MARINDVEIKNLKSFMGSEGWCSQGNVYLNRKKLGFWSQDGRGGSDVFEFDESLLSEAAENFKAGFPDTYAYKEFCDAETLMYKLAELKEIETACKKDFRNGYNAVIVVTDSIHQGMLAVASDSSDSELLRKYADVIADMMANLCRDIEPRIKVFRPNGFDITIDATHPAEDFFMND